MSSRSTSWSERNMLCAPNAAATAGSGGRFRCERYSCARSHDLFVVSNAVARRSALLDVVFRFRRMDRTTRRFTTEVDHQRSDQHVDLGLLTFWSHVELSVRRDLPTSTTRLCFQRHRIAAGRGGGKGISRSCLFQFRHTHNHWLRRHNTADTAGALRRGEGVTGQFYLAILVARLVSMLLAQSTTPSTSDASSSSSGEAV